EAFLAARLVQALQAQGRDRREPPLLAVAETLAGQPGGAALAEALAGIASSLAHHLALSLAARLPAPLSRGAVLALQPLLANRRVPEPVRLAAAAALLRTTGPAGPAADKVLRALITRSGKARSVDRLRH